MILTLVVSMVVLAVISYRKMKFYQRQFSKINIPAEPIRTLHQRRKISLDTMHKIRSQEQKFSTHKRENFGRRSSLSLKTRSSLDESASHSMRIKMHPGPFESIRKAGRAMHKLSALRALSEVIRRPSVDGQEETQHPTNSANFTLIETNSTDGLQVTSMDNDEDDNEINTIP